MRLGRVLVALVAVATLAAACGGSDDDGGSDEAAEAFDPAAVLRVASTLDFAAEPSIFDPTKVRSSTPFDVSRLVYDTLLRQGPDGRLVPGLAKEATIVTPQQIDVELHPDIRFTDGTPLDAEAVRFNVEHNKANGAPAGFRGEFFQIDRVEVRSPLELTLHFKTPVAGTFYDRMALHESVLISPKAIQEGVDLRFDPVGAGPFRLVEVSPDKSRIVLEKNPDYFQADDIKVAGIELIHMPSPEATVNALLADQIDVAMPVFSFAGQLEGRDDIDLDIRVSADSGDNVIYCKNRPPFDSIEVRKALNHAVDREAINEVIYQGKGEPIWSLFPEDHPLYDESMDEVYPYDPTKAKSLLAAAGYPNGVAFEMTVTADNSRVGEVVQQQARAAGFDITLRTSNNVIEDFYRGVKTPAAVSTYTGAYALIRNYGPGVVGNVCGYDNQQLLSVLNQTSAVARYSDESKELWEQVEKVFMRDEAAAVHLVFRPQANAWRDRVDGEAFIIDILGRPSLDLFKLYVEADS